MLSKELILNKLRFIYPTVNWSDLEKLYYVWLDPNFKEEWVKGGITKNLNCSYSLEQRLEEKGLIIVKLTVEGKKEKVKGLPDNVMQALSQEDNTVLIEYFVNKFFNIK